MSGQEPYVELFGPTTTTSADTTETLPSTAVGQASTPVTPTSSNGQDPEKRNPHAVAYLSFHDLFTQPRLPTRWLAKPLIAAGRVTTLVSPGKVGKSLLAMEAGAAKAIGLAVLLSAAEDPISVVYIDQEMTPEDWLDRLTDMGYGPANAAALDQSLHLAQLQPWLPMDTAPGGSLVLAAAEDAGAQLVIIDTVSKVTKGEENSNDTHAAFYRNTIMPLKRRGIAVLILDHTGKDVERGARGGSAKTDNVDLAFELLTRGRDLLSLKCTHARFRDAALLEPVYLRREADPALTHVVESVDQVAEDAISTCVRAIRALSPMQSTPGIEVLTQLRKAGQKWREQTFYAAWKRYQIDCGWINE